MIETRECKTCGMKTAHKIVSDEIDPKTLTVTTKYRCLTCRTIVIVTRSVKDDKDKE